LSYFSIPIFIFRTTHSSKYFPFKNEQNLFFLLRHHPCFCSIRKEKNGYWKLQQEALNGSLWRIRFGRGYGRIIRQTCFVLIASPAVKINSIINLRKPLSMNQTVSNMPDVEKQILAYTTLASVCGQCPCMHVLHMIFTIQIDWFPKQHYPIGLSDGYRVCSLWGRNWFCTVYIL